jgi:hypothetical protein
MNVILDFGRTCLSETFSTPFAACHAEIADAIVQGGTPERQGFVFGGARGHGFTSLLGVLVPLYRICERPDGLAVILTRGLNEAAGLAGVVRHELRHNAALRAAYPHLQGIDPARFQGVTIRPFHGGNLRGLRHRGKRPDLLVMDNIAGDFAALTVEQRNRRQTQGWDMLTSVVLPLLDPKGLFVYGGALDLDADPLLAYLMMGFATMRFTSRMYRAADSRIEDDTATPLWPERWNLDALRSARLTVGADQFDREWLGY